MMPTLAPIGSWILDDRWLMPAAGIAFSVTLVAMLALVLCHCLAERAAALRHAILVTVIVVAVLAPFLHGSLAALGWGWLQVSAATTTGNDGPTAATTHVIGRDHATAPIPTAGDMTAATGLTAHAHAAKPVRPMWLPTARAVGTLLCGVWLVGMLAGLLGFGLDLLRLRRFLGTLHPCGDAAALELLTRAARAVGLAQQPRLCESAAAAMPLVACGSQPVIVMPAGLTGSLDPERLFAVLAHESAHILRGDLWIGCGQRLAAVGFWWCPAIAAVNARLAILREQICDSHVMAAQGVGLPLAETLVDLAGSLRGTRPQLLHGTLGTVTSRSGLVDRVRRLVDGRPCDTRTNRRGRLVISGFVALALTIVGGSTITHAADRPATAAGLTPLTEGELAAIDAAHAWIVRQQQADGSWTFTSLQRPNADAATALALLAFMGRGHTHRQGPYQKQFAKGLDLLVARVADDGGREVATAGTMYAAGIVSLAICRAYGLSRDEALAKPAQATLDFLADAQDPKGGGWRYQPRMPGDTSATGWQVAALATGLSAGLEVKPVTITGVTCFLDSVQVDTDGTGYGYVNAQNPTPSCSAIGMVARLCTGWTPDDARLGRGADAIASLGPSANLYTDYHSSQLLHILGGDRNKAWRAAVVPPLLAAQARDGDDRGSWLAGFEKTVMADRLYCTTLATLILETPLLPRPPRPQ